MMGGCFGSSMDTSRVCAQQLRQAHSTGTNLRMLLIFIESPNCNSPSTQSSRGSGVFQRCFQGDGALGCSEIPSLSDFATSCPISSQGGRGEFKNPRIREAEEEGGCAALFKNVENA